HVDHGFGDVGADLPRIAAATIDDPDTPGPGERRVDRDARAVRRPVRIEGAREPERLATGREIDRPGVRLGVGAVDVARLQAFARTSAWDEKDRPAVRGPRGEDVVVRAARDRRGFAFTDPLSMELPDTAGVAREGDFLSTGQPSGHPLQLVSEGN